MWVGMVKELFKHVDKVQSISLQEVSDKGSAVEDMEKEFNKLTMPVGLVSITFALALLGPKSEFYRSQLGIPEEVSDEFKTMRPVLQERTRKFYPKKGKSLLKKCLAIFTKPPDLRFPFPFLPSGTDPRDFVMQSLHHLLDEMQQLSFDILDEAATVK